MRTIVARIFAVALLSTLCWRVQAADPAANSADEQSLRAACEDYTKAINSGDAAAHRQVLDPRRRLRQRCRPNVQRRAPP